jgi:DNA-damage-inducible protein J
MQMCYSGSMNNTATVHARLDPKTKRESERVLHKIGMTPTEAVRLLYRQIALRREFPLELRVPNKLTAKTLDKSDRDEEIETFDSLDEMAKSWNE